MLSLFWIQFTIPFLIIDMIAIISAIINNSPLLLSITIPISLIAFLGAKRIKVVQQKVGSVE